MRHLEFATNHEKQRGFWSRLFETVGIGFLTVGLILAVSEFWTDPTWRWESSGRLAVPLLLASIACFLIYAMTHIEGILVELSYLRERLLKEGD